MMEKILNELLNINEPIMGLRHHLYHINKEGMKQVRKILIFNILNQEIQMIDRQSQEVMNKPGLWVKDI